MRPLRSSDAMLTALPLAAGFTVQLASWLPVRFSYRENSLGIVSLATLRRYPLQQESFWLVFAALALGLLAWALSRALRPAGAAPGTQATAFAFAVLGLLLALWLPGAAGALACGAAAAVALGWVRRAGSLETASDAQPALAPRTSTRRSDWLLVAVAVLVSLPLTPGIWMGVWNVVFATPDVQLVADNFNFHAEIGQHLAWADAIRRGGLHGRDFFCLYGPLHEFGLVAAWELTRRSIAVYRLYVSLGRAASYAVAILLCAALVRRKSLVLLLPLLLPYVDPRVGLPLAGLLALTQWLKTGRRGLALAGRAARGDVAALQPGVRARAAGVGGRGPCRDARRPGRGRVLARARAPCWSPCSAGSPRRERSAPMLSDVVQYPALHARGLRQAALPVAGREPPAAPGGAAGPGLPAAAPRLLGALRLRARRS